MRLFRIRRWWIPPVITVLLFFAFVAIQWRSEARAVEIEMSMGHYSGYPGFLHDWVERALYRRTR